MKYEIVFYNSIRRIIYNNKGLNLVLTDFEFKLFYTLLCTNSTVSTDNLISEIWGDSSFKQDKSNLIQLVSKLRRILKPLSEISILSERGVGYRLSIEEHLKFEENKSLLCNDYSALGVDVEYKQKNNIIKKNINFNFRSFVYLCLISISVCIFIYTKMNKYPSFVEEVLGEHIKLKLCSESIYASER